MNQYLLNHATGHNLLRSLGVVLITFVLFVPLIAMFMASSDGQMPLDNQTSLTVESMYSQMLTYQPSAKWVYLAFFVVDFIFPPAFSLVFCLFIGWRLNKLDARSASLFANTGLMLLPFGSALADWFENIGNLIVIFSYPNQLPNVAVIAVVLKQIKFSLLGLNIVLCFAVSAFVAVKRVRP